jgi:hypothetical protein
MKVYVVFYNYSEGPEGIRALFYNEEDALKCVKQYPQSSIEVHKILDNFIKETP